MQPKTYGPADKTIDTGQITRVVRSGEFASDQEGTEERLKVRGSVCRHRSLYPREIRDQHDLMYSRVWRSGTINCRSVRP